MVSPTRKQTSFIKFLFDVSGVPKKDNTGKYQKVIVSCVSVNAISLNDLIDDFREHHPSLWNKKGSQLTADKLEVICDYLNKNKVRMLTVTFNPINWEKYKRKYPSEAHLEEKIMSLLYFKPLKAIARNINTYQILFDSDTSFNIKQSVKLCQRLSRQHSYSFQPSFGYVDLNPELKLADWVASAARKVDEDTLKKHRYYTKLNNKLLHHNLRIVLKKI